jgi:hypothetical protein
LAGEEGNGLVTNEVNPEILKNKLLPAFKEGVENSTSSSNNNQTKDYNSNKSSIHAGIV